MEEYIPVFEENKGTELLARIDNFEDSIKELNRLTKQYDELKSEIKEQMVTFGRENNHEKVKWITPNQIQITCSIGKPAQTEEVTERVFSEAYLQEKYPDIYKECFVEKTSNKTIKAASSDRLTITLPKEK